MGSIAKAMKDALEATCYSELRDYQRKTIEAYTGSIHFRSFIWRGLRCHRVADCSVDFSRERLGLKPKFPWH